jgi:fructokinase
VIISAGEALVDLVPDPRPGGGPMNVAVTAARLGAPAAFAGRVSTDAYGKAISDHLEASGVDLRITQRGPEPTARAIVEHTPTPRFRFEGEGTADVSLDPFDLTVLGPGPHLLHGGTLGLFRPPGAAVLADLLDGHDGLVSLDPNVRPSLIEDRAHWHACFDRWLSRADVVRGSDEDVAWIAPDLGAEQWAAGLLDRGVGVVLITRGAAGVTVHLRSGTVRVPAVAVTVVDTVGAGDSFCGAVLTALWERAVADRGALDRLTPAAWGEIVGFAARVAALTCSRVGADPPWRSELPSERAG